MGLIKQELTSEQKEKAQDDLRVINLLNKLGKEKGLRIIISGGYAVDGFLGEITRYHNDIDIQIYGVDQDAESVVQNLLDIMNQSFEIKEKERKLYYRNFYASSNDAILDIYYLQTKTNPLDHEKYIIRSDGSIDEQKFEEPKFGKIGNISFEIQDPTWELKDKIYKREERGDLKRSEHEQDIENLKQVLEKA